MRLYSLLFPIIPGALLLTACQHDQPGVEVRTITVDREVQKPCPGIVPKRPAKLEPLPDNPVSALALALAKLAAYSAPGEYADQAEAYVKACPPSG